MNIGALGVSGQSAAAATLSDLSDRLKTAKAQKADAQKTDAQKAADQLRDLPKKTRDDARAQARARVMQLVERLKIIKKLGEADPKLMAKMLAQLMKELKAAVKDYAKAGGNTSDVAGFSAAQGTASAPAAETRTQTPEETSGEPATEDAKSPETADVAAAETTAKVPTDQALTTTPLSDSRAAAEAYVKTTRALAESELLEVNDFMKQVRGLVKVVKDLFETAKIKLTFQTVDKDTVEAFRSSGEDMKAIEDTLDALDHDLNDERAVYGPRAALYA